MGYHTEDRERFFAEDWDLAKEAFERGNAMELPPPTTTEQVAIMYSGVMKLRKITEMLMRIIDDDREEIAALKAAREADSYINKAKGH